MHPYIPHLLRDIAAAHQTEQPEYIPHKKSFEEEMEDIERWAEGEEHAHTFVIIAGYRQKIFHRRNSLQKKKLNS